MDIGVPGEKLKLTDKLQCSSSIYSWNCSPFPLKCNKKIIGDWALETSEGQFIGNDRVHTMYLTEKNGLFVNQCKSEHQYSTLAKAAMDKWFVNFLKWKDSFCILEIWWHALQRTFQHWLKSSQSGKLVAGRANCSGQIISLRCLTRFQMR